MAVFRLFAFALVSMMLLAGCTSMVQEVEPLERHLLASELPKDVAQGLDLLKEARAEPLVIERPLTVHVVAVGWDLGLLDEAAVTAALPSDLSPRIEFSPNMPAGLRGGLSHRIDYAFHQAPEAFTEALFGSYQNMSKEVPIPGGDSGFLARYDQMYGFDRAGSGSMRLVDVQAVEERIEALRQEHDLMFDGPHATVFLLDSWTEYGLWRDQYYHYAFHGDLRAGPDTVNLRAWGGTHDFLFLDRSAAPNDAKTDRSGVTTAYYVLGSQPVYAPEGTAYNDPPVWHYTGDTATVGQGEAQKQVTLDEAIIGNLDPAVNLRILSDYIFRPSYAERYHVSVHLWHDGRSMIPSADLDALVDAELVRRSMQEAVPWADVEVSIQTYVAPEDDPGMDEAMRRAKAEGAGAQLAMPVLLNHVEAHPEQYKRDEEGTIDVLALGFILESHYAVVVPLGSGGAAVTGPDNTCWGGTASVNDAYYLQKGRSVEAMEATLTHIYAHELGHCFGLPHAHDGTRRTQDGYETALDHTWSSTNTTMSYRIATAGVDHFHRASLARAHVLDNVERVLRDLEWAYRALDEDGRTRAPADLLASMSAAAEQAEEAMSHYHDGDDLEAARLAVDARRIAEAAMHAAGVQDQTEVEASWSATGVNSAGRKHSAFVFRPGAAAPSIQYDFKPLVLGEDAERVTVRATWTNSAASWGDFFVGWRAPGVLSPIFVDPGPASQVFSLGTGIHDVVDEGPLDGKVVREFTLDLDHFPGLRAEGVVFEAGAGTQGSAVNGAYTVELLVERRVV